MPKDTIITSCYVNDFLLYSLHTLIFLGASFSFMFDSPGGATSTANCTHQSNIGTSGQCNVLYLTPPNPKLCLCQYTKKLTVPSNSSLTANTIDGKLSKNTI